MSDAESGFGTTFGVEGGTPDVFPVLANVVSIKPPGKKRDAMNATHLKSPGGWKEFKPSALKELGDASIGLNFHPDNEPALAAIFDAGEGRFQIGFVGGAKLTFSAVVTEYDPQEITNEKMSASITLKPSGQAVWEVAPGG